ncbi:MAG TPA: 5-formyltetrahydrofolate cyclo-ligase [Caulobacteraceae bacterium]
MAPDSSPLALAKGRIRRQMRRSRVAAGPAGAQAAETAAGHLPPSLVQAARTVAGYHPQGGEIDPAPLLRRFAAAGAQLALPVAVAPDTPLEFRAWSEGDALEPDVFGIPSPTADRRQVQPDLILAPVLAFDRRGGRVGQGVGCFDRTLQQARASGPVRVIGLAFACQEVERAPTAAHDQALDAILTESGYIEAEKDI